MAVSETASQVLAKPKGNSMLNLYTDLELRVREFGRKATRDEGATAVEYGLLVALIAAVIVLVVLALGGQVRAAFQSIVNAL